MILDIKSIFVSMVSDNRSAPGKLVDATKEVGNSDRVIQSVFSENWVNKLMSSKMTMQPLSGGIIVTQTVGHIAEGHI